MSDRVKTGHVKAMLMKRFCAPEWALMFEVGDATGARHTRFADAVAMSLWPSRGLELHGIEIKVSRSDWQAERKNPVKAETIARFCERWVLVTGPGVVHDIAEIPPAWGWLELVDDRFYERKKAERTPAEPMSRAFLAALLRRASCADQAVIDALVAKKDADREAQFNDRVDQALRYRSQTLTDLQRTVTDFETASGITIADGGRGWGLDPKATGRAVKMLKESGLVASFNRVANLAKSLREIADQAEKAAAEFGIEPQPDPAETLAKFARRR